MKNCEKIIDPGDVTKFLWAKIYCSPKKSMRFRPLLLYLHRLFRKASSHMLKINKSKNLSS